MTGHRPPQPRDLEDLKQLMERVGEPDERMQKLLRLAAVDAATYADLQDLYRQKAALTATKDTFYPYEPITGAFQIGTDPDGHMVGLTREQVNEHMLIVGMTGAGKTTFFYNMMAQSDTLDIPYLVFDFKNDYRHLIQHQDLLVINWRDLKFNPLAPPPGVQSGKWGEILADTFAHATDLLIGSESYFLEKLRQLYQFYEDTTHWPSLFELRDFIAVEAINPASPTFKYKERVESRLSMMTGFSGDIFDCSRGYPIEALLARNVALELKEPNQYVTNFVVEALLTWIFYYRDAMGQRQGLRHLVMFDEAKRVFDVNRARQPASGYPPIDDLAGKLREFGEALIVADHEPSKLSDSLKANTNAKLWLTLGSGRDIDEMARTFGLDREEVDFTRTLQKGEGLLKLAAMKPVPVLLPDYRLDKSLTESDIRDRMAAELADLDVHERVRPDRFNEYLGTTGEDATDEEEETADIGEIAEALLASVTDTPFLSMSERYKSIDVDSKKGTAAKTELVKLGLVREVTVPTGRPGRNPKLLELTPEGRTVLEERGHNVPETGRRGIVHRYWQHQIKDYYAAEGFDVELEYAVGTQRIDVYAQRADERIAVEVACSPEHEVTNIEKCLDAGVDQVQVVYIEETVKDRIQSAVQDEFGHLPDQVIFKPISAFA